jgi:hypothetical protein
VSLGTRIVTLTTCLPMSIPAARSQNSGSSGLFHPGSPIMGVR